MSPALPETLRAPFLCRLALHGIGLPKGSSLLSSMIALSTLSITHIRDSCYFTPRDLVIQLQGLNNLEELSIGFAIAIPLPSSEGERLPAPIPPVTLPALRRFTYRGLGVYIDNVVAQINTPLLERLTLTLLFDLDFAPVNLTDFIHRTKGFRCSVAQVNFNKDGASVCAGIYEQRGIAKLGIVKLSLHINCEPLDWQIDSATQVCSTLGNFLSTVEELTLDLNVDGMPSDWQDTLDSMVWHNLLLPFIGVKKLQIGSSLMLDLSQTLESDAGRLLLPELQELEVPLEIDLVANPFSMFMKTRESVGCPVVLKPVLQRSVSGTAESPPDMINYIPPPPGPPLPINSKHLRFGSRGSELGSEVHANMQTDGYLAAGSSIRCTLLHVKYGTYEGKAAGLIVFEANFDFPAEESRTKGATIHVSFSLADPEKPTPLPKILHHSTLAVRSTMIADPKFNVYQPVPGRSSFVFELGGSEDKSSTYLTSMVMDYNNHKGRRSINTVLWTISENEAQRNGVHPIFCGAIIVQLPDGDEFDGLFCAQFKLHATQACEVQQLETLLSEFWSSI